MRTTLVRNAFAAVRMARGDVAISCGVGLSAEEIRMVADLLDEGSTDSLAAARPIVKSVCRWNRETCAATGAGQGGDPRRRPGGDHPGCAARRGASERRPAR